MFVVTMLTVLIYLEVMNVSVHLDLLETVKKDAHESFNLVIKTVNVQLMKGVYEIRANVSHHIFKMDLFANIHASGNNAGKMLNVFWVQRVLNVNVVQGVQEMLTQDVMISTSVIQHFHLIQMDLVQQAQFA